MSGVDPRNTQVVNNLTTATKYVNSPWSAMPFMGKGMNGCVIYID
jgi:hypothetical protein